MRMCKICVNCLRTDDCAECVFCKVSFALFNSNFQIFIERDFFQYVCYLRSQLTCYQLLYVHIISLFKSIEFVT